MLHLVRGGRSPDVLRIQGRNSHRHPVTIRELLVDQSVSRVSIADMEQTLCQVAEIKAARVVVSPEGVIQEIHVLAMPSKSPKQLVRDIESTLMAAFGIAVDHKKISIAQLGQEELPKTEAPTAAPQVRPKIRAINVDVNGLQSTVNVSLEIEGDLYVGEATGPASQTGRQRLVAQAALNAIGEYSHSSAAFALEDVGVTQLGREQVAVAAVVLLTPFGEQTYSGSALVRQNEKDSIVRATMDAINRRLGFLTTQ